MASAAYNQWVAAVKSNGGRVAVSPSGEPSAAYPASSWVPRVNAGTWPLPDSYSKDGQTAYYTAPAALLPEIRSFSQATPSEIKSGAEQLMNQWGIPKGLQSLSNYFSAIKSNLLIAGIVAGVYFYLTSRKRR